MKFIALLLPLTMLVAGCGNEQLEPGPESVRFDIDDGYGEFRSFMFGGRQEELLGIIGGYRFGNCVVNLAVVNPSVRQEAYLRSRLSSDAVRAFLPEPLFGSCQRVDVRFQPAEHSIADLVRFGEEIAQERLMRDQLFMLELRYRDNALVLYTLEPVLVAEVHHHLVSAGYPENALEVVAYCLPPNLTAPLEVAVRDASSNSSVSSSTVVSLSRNGRVVYKHRFPAEANVPSDAERRLPLFVEYSAVAGDGWHDKSVYSLSIEADGYVELRRSLELEVDRCGASYKFIEVALEPK